MAGTGAEKKRAQRGTTPFDVQDLRTLLRGLGDDGAGNARWRGAGRFGGDGVDDHGGAAVAENGVSVGAQRNVGSDDGGMSGAVGADDQRKVGDVARGEAAGGVIVVGAIGIEVRTGGLEVWTVALGELMDVERMFAGREIFDVQLDAYAVRRLRERGRADDLILTVFDVDGEGFCRWRRGGDGDGCRQEQAEKR